MIGNLYIGNLLYLHCNLDTYIFVIYGICFGLYMQEIYIWLALLLLYKLASIMEI